MATALKVVENKLQDRQDGNARAEQIALVTGASSGIGLALVDQLLADESCSLVYAGCRSPEQSFALRDRAAEEPRLQPIRLDVTDSHSIRLAVEQMAEIGRLDVVINTAGVLHSVDGMKPEKRLADVDTNALLRAYDVNALGMLRLAMELEPLLKASRTPRFVSLSARVGSISDNRLGGWYAYRASKAALNMLMRTLSIEWSRLRPPIVCAVLHPGTVDTALSAPFTANHRTRLFSPAEAAANLLGVIGGLSPERNGEFLAWDGTIIPW